MDLSEYKQLITKLILSDISDYQIYKETGVSHTVMSSLRMGLCDLDNLTLKTTEKLYEYAKAHLNE